MKLSVVLEALKTTNRDRVPDHKWFFGLCAGKLIRYLVDFFWLHYWKAIPPTVRSMLDHFDEDGS